MIRLALPSDGPRLAEIYRPAIEESGVSFEEIAPDGSEMRQRVEKVLLRFPWVVVEQEGIVTGYAYASRHRERPAYAWSAEVSIYVDQTRHRSGSGRQLYATLFDILALQGFQSVFAGVIEPNPPSLGFHLSMGFTEVGRYRSVGYKGGRWCDTVWLQRRIGSLPVPPSPIQPLPALAGSRELAAILGAAAPRHSPA